VSKTQDKKCQLVKKAVAALVRNVAAICRVRMLGRKRPLQQITHQDKKLAKSLAPKYDFGATGYDQATLESTQSTPVVIWCR
jgi:hypothetical protein